MTAADEDSLSGDPDEVLNAVIEKENREKNDAERLATAKMAELIQQAQAQAAEHRADFAERTRHGKPIGRRRKA